MLAHINRNVRRERGLFLLLYHTSMIPKKISKFIAFYCKTNFYFMSQV